MWFFNFSLNSIRFVLSFDSSAALYHYMLSRFSKSTMFNDQFTSIIIKMLLIFFIGKSITQIKCFLYCMNENLVFINVVVKKIQNTHFIRYLLF